VTLDNCYYIDAAADHSEQGIRGYAVNAGSGVKIGLNGTPGIVYNGTVYAGKGEEANLTLAYEGGKADGFVSSSGTLTQNGDNWTITMPGEEVTIDAKIAPKKITPKLSLSTKTYVYNGKVKNPTLTVKDGSTKLVKGTDYKVTVPKGRKNPGKYTYKVTLMGKYEGSGSISFTINPKATTLKSVKAAKKALTVTWAKQSPQVSGYEILIATNKNFTKGKKTITVSGATNTSKKITGLKAKTKYWVKIRTYKTSNSKKYYSKWSKAKYATTKA
ncbi:MAG: fibronectin type III domain-containing protein, partial [Firmicutes bacterium]|nr:fibronectin type III domain-containing protein [Bacillota bacterium]